MTGEDGSHTADPDVHLRIDRPEGVDQGAVVRHEAIPVVREVAGVGVVESQVDHRYVGLEIECRSILLRLHVGIVSVPEEGRPAVTEVSHLIPLAEELTENGGVGLRCRILQPVPVGDRVADAGDSDALSRERGHKRQEAP